MFILCYITDYKVVSFQTPKRKEKKKGGETFTDRYIEE